MGRIRTVSWTTKDEIEFVDQLGDGLPNPDRIDRIKLYVRVSMKKPTRQDIDMEKVFNRCKILISRYEYDDELVL